MTAADAFANERALRAIARAAGVTVDAILALARVRDRCGEAVETVQLGPTAGKSPTAKPGRPGDTP